MDCIFCRIVQKESPAEILYETYNVLAMLDIRPIHFGHALVIPKSHCVDFLTLPEQSFHDIMHATQIVARALVKTFDLEGFNVFSNNGRIAGQSVFHFHLHIVPRYVGDAIRFAPMLKSYTGRSMAENGERIRRNIQP
ncbi:MAG: Hit-like cell-cycle regulation protein [Bacteroidetes bacterium]|jgi:histidine triad (HIT) family protein|nr:Hit-like cell-cycle regulation protein [Bacteroidota bacterium]